MHPGNSHLLPWLEVKRVASRIARAGLYSLVLLVMLFVSLLGLGPAAYASSSVGSRSTTPNRELCSITIWTEQATADDYQSDSHGTYHLQAQLWALVDAYTQNYCGKTYAKSLLWVPSGGVITDNCVSLAGTSGTSQCSSGNSYGGGPYILQAGPTSTGCGYAGGSAFNNDNPWNLVALTGTYPC